MTTIAAMLRARAEDDNVGLRFEDQQWTYRELLAACEQRAALFAARRAPGEPFHIGVLADNVPDFWMVLGAAALSGATVVGINPTRRGSELARDVAHTDCAFLVTESDKLELFEDIDLSVPPQHRFVVDTPEWAAELAPFAGATPPDAVVSETDPFVLIFTSGTTGAPKAVRMSHGRLAAYGTKLAEGFGLGPHTVGYASMPLFHSNALVAGYSNLLAVGAVCVLRRRFSASGFLPDIRHYGANFFNYVGKPLTYILATPEHDDDADNPLQIAFGNEAAPLDIERFSRRFGCLVIDGYGSTEGGTTITKTLETPRGSLGLPSPGVDAAVYDPTTALECPRARFDERGRIVNAAEAVGEIVNPQGAGGFEGYYNNPEANAERMRDGIYWTGDLGYRDEDGFFYFAGRNSDWLRVDGENFAAAPVEEVISRHPDVLLCAVYAVPSVDVGDDVMVAIVLREGAEFDPSGFVEFLDAQHDLSPKSRPRYVRIAGELPSTQTMKVLKRVLRSEHWACDDPVWWVSGRLGDASHYTLMEEADREGLRHQLTERGRDHLLGRV